MAFCKYCGTPLLEGEECTCEKAVAAKANAGAQQAPQQGYQQASQQQYQQAPQQPYQQAPQQGYQQQYQQAPQQGYQQPYQQAPQQGGVDYNELMNKGQEMVGGLFQQFLKIWKKPADENKVFVKRANMVEGLIFMGIQALLSGILVLALFSKVNSMINSTLGSLMGLAGMGSASIGLPYAKGFFFVFFMSVLASGLNIGLTCLVFMIMKAKMDVKEIINFAALRSVAAIPFTLVAIVFSLLNMTWGLGVNAFALVFSFAFLLSGMDAFEDIDKNKRGYLVSAITLVAILVVIVIASTMIKSMLGSALGDAASALQYLM